MACFNISAPTEKGSLQMEPLYCLPISPSSGGTAVLYKYCVDALTRKFVMMPSSELLTEEIYINIMYHNVHCTARY